MIKFLVVPLKGRHYITTHCSVQNIQSTNWQTLRFKPPPPGTDIGWRVEFRPTEVHVLIFISDFFIDLFNLYVYSCLDLTH